MHVVGEKLVPRRLFSCFYWINRSFGNCFIAGARALDERCFIRFSRGAGCQRGSPSRVWPRKWWLDPVALFFFGGTSPTLLSRFPFRRKKTKKNNKKDFARAEWHRLLSEPCSQSSAAVSAWKAPPLTASSWSADRGTLKSNTSRFDYLDWKVAPVLL